MSQSLYPVSREPNQRTGESALTKVLAVLLLLVAGALVVTVYQMRKHAGSAVSYEPHAIAQRPDDKLGADEKATIDVFDEFKNSVVHVTNLRVARNQITLDVNEIPQGTGSGFIWDEAGYIVTNFHVIQDADRASVTLNDGTTYPATIVGKTPDKDLAVLHIDADPKKLKKVLLAESSKLRVGQKVLAIGNPFGLDQTLTTGVISGLGREIKSVSGRPIYDVIQTDASINPGNSGGPLLDSAGRLIGINTAIYSPSGANAGIGFAVPSDTINSIIPQLLKYGKIQRPGLGINIFNDSVAMQKKVDGVIVIQATPGGAAANAGVEGTHQTQDGLEMGDVIVGLDTADIHKEADLYRALEAHKVGDTVELRLENQGQKRSVKVQLQALP